MKRYNLIIDPVDTPGLWILETENFVRRIYSDPGWNILNLGDFRSEIRVSELAEKVVKTLDDYFIEGMERPKSVIVDASEFSIYKCSKKCEYFVESEQGLRIYFPTIHKEELDPVMQYQIVALAFIDQLIEGDNGSIHQYLRSKQHIKDDMDKRLKKTKDAIIRANLQK